MNKAVSENRSDSFETQVYYVDSLDLFHTIDFYAKPSMGVWVVVRRFDSSGLAIQRFHGQPFIGVAKVLHFYQLAQSEQRTLIDVLVYPD